MWNFSSQSFSLDNNGHTSAWTSRTFCVQKKMSQRFSVEDVFEQSVHRCTTHTVLNCRIQKEMSADYAGSKDLERVVVVLVVVEVKIASCRCVKATVEVVVHQRKMWLNSTAD